MGGGGRLASNEIDEDDDGGAISLKFQGEASMQSLPKIPSASPARPKTRSEAWILNPNQFPLRFWQCRKLGDWHTVEFQHDSNRT